MARDTVAEFKSFLEAHGLIPRVVAADGKVRRCGTMNKPKSTNGAYMLFADGLGGWCQDWSTMGDKVVWRFNGEGRSDAPPPKVDRAAIRRKQEEYRRKRQEATEAARKFFAEKCRPLRGGHDYLRSQMLGMEGCGGLKVDPDGWLVVPAYRGRDLISLQRIAPDGQKRFWSGASMKGVSFTIERRTASVTILCEGLATGLALFVAVPMARVVVAFSASNMAVVAKQMERRGMAVVAADNDHQTAERIGRNPGVEAAKAAAEVLGCGVMIPEGIEGTDWSDYRQEKLAERLDRQVYGKRQDTPGTIERVVHGEITSAALRNARLMKVA